MCCTIQEQSNFLHMHIGKPSGIPFVAPVVELCDQVTLLLVVVSWQYSYLVEVDPGVPQASPMLVIALSFLNCHGIAPRENYIMGRGQCVHVTSWEHRGDKRTPCHIDIDRSPGGAEHCHQQCGARSGSPQLIFIEKLFLLLLQ